MSWIRHRMAKPLVLVVTAVFFAGSVSVNADTYTIRGPEGNTIVVDEDSISGEFEGIDYSVTEDEATAEGHSTSDDDGGGGGGAGKAIAIAAGVALVAVAAGVGLWWYFNRYKPQHAAKDIDKDGSRVVIHQLSDDAEIALMPKLMELAECTDANPPEQSVDDLTAFDVALRVRF